MADELGYVGVDNNLTTLTTEAEGPKRITQAELQNYIGLPIEFVGLSSQTPASLEATHYGVAVSVPTSDKIQIKFDGTNTQFQKIRQVKVRGKTTSGGTITNSTLQNDLSVLSMTQNTIILVEVNKEVIGKEFYKGPSANDVPIFSHINDYAVSKNKVATTSSTKVYGDMYTVPVDSFGINGKQGEGLSFPKGTSSGINRDNSSDLRYILPADTYGDGDSKLLPIYKNGRTGYWPKGHLYDSTFDSYINGLGTDVIDYTEQYDDTNPDIEGKDDTTVRLGTKTIIVPKGTKIGCFRRSGTGTPSITKAVNVSGDNSYLVDNPFGISKQNEACIWARTRRTWFFGWTEFDAALHIISHNNEGSHFKIKLPIKLDWGCSSRDYESSTGVEVTDLIPDFNLSHGIRKLIQKVGAGSSYSADGCGGETGRQTIKKLAPTITKIEHGEDSNKTDTELLVDLSSPFQYSYYYEGYNLIPCNGREGGLLTSSVSCTRGGTDNAADQSREVAAYLYMKSLAGVGVVTPGIHIMSPLTTGCKRGSDYDIESRTIPGRTVAFGKAQTRKWPLYGAHASDGTGHKVAADFEFEIESYDSDKYAYAIIIEYPEPVGEVQQLISYTTKDGANTTSTSFSSYFYDKDTTQPSLGTIKQIDTNNVCFSGGTISSTSVGSSSVTNGVGVLSFTCTRSGTNPNAMKEYRTRAYYTTAEAQSSPHYELYINSSGDVCCDITNRANVARTFYYYSESNASVKSLTVAAGATSTIARSSGASSKSKLHDSGIQYSSGNATYKTPLPGIKRKYGNSSLITVERGTAGDTYVLRVNNHSDLNREFKLYYNGNYKSYTVSSKSSKLISSSSSTINALLLQVQYYLPENCQYYEGLYPHIPATLKFLTSSKTHTGNWEITNATSGSSSNMITVNIPLNTATACEVSAITCTLTSHPGGSGGARVKESSITKNLLTDSNTYQVKFQIEMTGGGSSGRMAGGYSIAYKLYTVQS